MAEVEYTMTRGVLEIKPPYGMRIVQHMHHVELHYAAKDISSVMEWLRDLYALLVHTSINTKIKSVPCPDCMDGYHIDESVKSDLFPQGVPTMCPTCAGTKRLEVNDIIVDEEKTSPDNPIVNVVPDNGTNEVMKPE